MRGQFSPDAKETEWCERRLLARIHRYTVNRLRQEIEPVEARDFMRFLFEWQRVAPEARVEGADAVANIVSQLEGFEAPAAAWETEILPARVNEYDPAWLDELSRAGRVVWTRIAPLSTKTNGASGERAPSPVRTTPIALASRRNLAIWAALAPDGERHDTDVECAAGGGVHHDTRRIVLRGDRRRDHSVAHASRASARRACRAGSGQCRQLRWVARVARAVGSPPHIRRPKASSPHCAVRHRGRRTLGAGAKAPGSGRRRHHRTCRPHAVAPLRRRVLAADRTRGGVVAAVARSVEMLSTTRSPRRNSWRAFRCRTLWRAVRCARSDRSTARYAAARADGCIGEPERRRPAEPGGHSESRCAIARADR